MVDLLNVSLAVIAIFSALFVALSEGFKITLGFRGSEETRQRKERIDIKLHRELNDEIEDFLSSDACRGGSPDRIIGIQDLGFKAMLAEDAANDLITRSDKSMKNAIKNLLAGTLILFVTVAVLISVDFTQLDNLIFAGVYVGITAFLFWRFASSTMKSLHYREQLITLDDEPTLQKAEEVDLE